MFHISSLARRGMTSSMELGEWGNWRLTCLNSSPSSPATSSLTRTPMSSTSWRLPAFQALSFLQSTTSLRLSSVFHSLPP